MDFAVGTRCHSGRSTASMHSTALWTAHHPGWHPPPLTTSQTRVSTPDRDPGHHEMQQINSSCSSSWAIRSSICGRSRQPCRSQDQTARFVPYSGSGNLYSHDAARSVEPRIRRHGLEVLHGSLNVTQPRPSLNTRGSTLSIGQASPSVCLRGVAARK